MDQASGLRETVGLLGADKVPVQVIAVSSGKGGVGKTNMVANLAIACARKGRKVLVMDADLALGNMDILLGLAPTYTIEDVLSGHRTLDEVLVPGPGNIRILPATSGVQELTELTEAQRRHLQTSFLQLNDPPDLLLIDCAAGIAENVLYFNVIAHEILLVVSPDPGSLTDAYALVKILSTRYHQRTFRFLVNMARTHREAKEAFRKLSLVTDQFLHVTIDYMGCVPFDNYLSMAVLQQRPVIEAYPKAPSSQALANLASPVTRWRTDKALKGGFQLFGPAGLGLVTERIA